MDIDIKLLALGFYLFFLLLHLHNTSEEDEKRGAHPALCLSDKGASVHPFRRSMTPGSFQHQYIRCLQGSLLIFCRATCLLPRTCAVVIPADRFFSSEGSPDVTYIWRDLVSSSSPGRLSYSVVHTFVCTQYMFGSLGARELSSTSVKGRAVYILHHVCFIYT